MATRDMAMELLRIADGRAGEVTIPTAAIDAARIAAGYVYRGQLPRGAKATIHRALATAEIQLWHAEQMRQAA